MTSLEITIDITCDLSQEPRRMTFYNMKLLLLAPLLPTALAWGAAGM